MIKAMSAILIPLGLLAACSSAAVGPVSPAMPADGMLIDAGRQVAVLRCSRCHALDTVSQSPLPAAPPMAQMLARYNAEMLANDLIDGIRVGHDEMPELTLQVSEADALVASLQSLR